MTDTLRLFANALAAAGSQAVYKYNPSDSALVIKAKCRDVGDLKIFDEISELTVVIGKLHHTHFSDYQHQAASQNERLRLAARDAAAFVADVLNDRVLFTVRYKGGHCVGSSAEYVDPGSGLGDSIRFPLSAWWFRRTRTERYVWSGPVAVNDAK